MSESLFTIKPLVSGLLVFYLSSAHRYFYMVSPEDDTSRFNGLTGVHDEGLSRGVTRLGVRGPPTRDPADSYRLRDSVRVRSFSAHRD